MTTAPGVIYKVYKTNGEVINLTNPSNLPDPSEIEYMEEPMVNAEIMVTTEFIGAIMDLCQERRGQYLGMDYMEETRALLKYKLPLNEIIYDSLMPSNPAPEAMLLWITNSADMSAASL